ncbi:hypothetical protein [Nocardioides aequoreus]|uniref:hypothetical protein n=1 Tax=Nocardioides aequoreus TaxID=397278 RepID=UPI0004C36D54|nr:hypothetical protein [Nocardioides aequoreus]
MATRPGSAKPDHVYVARSPGRKGIAMLGIVAAVATASAGWRGWQLQSTGDLALAGGAAIVCVICWVFLTVTVPQKVIVTGSVVEIVRSSTTQRYDMEDPGVDMLVRDGSVAFGHYRDNWSIVQARDVDWKVFMDVVMRYQFQADINAEERDKRFSR